MQITLKEAEEKVSQLEGMFICHPWKGYGTAIFLELVGNIKDSKMSIHKEANSNKTNLVGEASISMWYWRIEKDMEIICGSSDSMPDIEEGISYLNGLEIESIKIVGIIPELAIQLKNGFRLLSFNSTSSFAENWSIKRANKEQYIGYEAGSFYETIAGEREEDDRKSHLENKLSKQAKAIAKRWKAPIEEPVAGLCKDCVYEIRIDGNYDLLSYSVCVNKNSIFDGKVVERYSSGCTVFLLDQEE